MNKDLRKKLSNYSAAAGAVAVASGATAQVNYTDVDPDYAHAGGTIAIGLDLNNDQTFDFALQSQDTTVNGTQYELTVIAPYGTAGNAIAGEAPSGYNYALALNANDMIDASVNWIAAANTMTYKVDGAFPYNENWNGVTDKYVGLQFVVGGNTHYGWARLDVDGDIWTLKDYAYDETADQGIAAGDMGGTVNIENTDINSLVHFINQANNSVLIKTNGDLTGGEVNVVSASGAVVNNFVMNNGNEVVDMTDLASGIYMVTVSFDQGTVTKKIFVK